MVLICCASINPVILILCKRKIPQTPTHIKLIPMLPLHPPGTHSVKLHLSRPPATGESGRTVRHSTGLRATRHNCTQKGRARGPTEQPVTLNHNSTHRPLERAEIEPIFPHFPCFDLFIPCQRKISCHYLDKLTLIPCDKTL